MTLYTGADREGEGSAATNTSATTSCIADLKAWTSVFDRLRAPSPIVGGGTMGVQLPPLGAPPHGSHGWGGRVVWVDP